MGIGEGEGGGGTNAEWGMANAEWEKQVRNSACGIPS